MELNGIVLSPDPRLKTECAPIEEITPEIRELAESMKQTMFEDGGVGLAAPQVGALVQMVLVDTEYSSAEDYDPYVLINPVIVEKSDTMQTSCEGCLSIPGITVEIARPDHVVVEAYNLDGELMVYEASNDLFCVCLQHEIDHLHGITMFDHLAPAARARALREYQEALARGAKPGDTE
ncbi:peptide deformylase [Collinsella sp. zg1085]|uniref:peptide deformylase n=1 Tax=Collinsella sp. zg1085 TaxID=2844380 RepID=UPI001C0B140E|nr:peptide deformylase [Collinsella sp. zg1085]QWT17144.1 peptide deformylase [Collinsella sp. zg1085]